MYSIDEYNYLVQKYGQYSSWAIWDDNTISDASIISQCIDHLHSRYILLGLNISKPISDNPWSNFHYGPSNVRKLKNASNKTELRGSYITDIFKNIEATDASDLVRYLNDEVITRNVNFFHQEMQDIKIDNDSIFIIFGKPTAKYFNKYFRQNYINRVIYHHHYSYYGLTDKEWVDELEKKWNKKT